MTNQTLLPRLAALELLAAVLKRHRPLDETLESNTAFLALNTRDRAFTRNLVATSLRRLGQIDDLLGQCLQKPLPRKAVGVRDILRIGACQLLFTRTEPHAAVSTTVSLCEERDFAGYKNLVNAILRRLSRQGEAMIKDQDIARLNTPAWLWRSWQTAFGEATCRKIALAHLQEAPLDISCKTSPDDWADKLDADVLATGTLRLRKSARVSSLPGFDEGAWWVQDAAAALPVRLLKSALENLEGKDVIDLCAAPGGKTAQLATSGAHVTAVERSANRMKRLEENFDRLRLTAETIVSDAEKWRPKEKADGVLLDAPCSATGTIRRHPDIPFLKSEEDVGKLSAAQLRLARAAVDMVKPGGTLVICTCSLQAEEGPEFIQRLLVEHPRMKRLPVKAEEIGDMQELVTNTGDLQSLPFHLSEHGGMDGFFISRLISSP